MLKLNLASGTDIRDGWLNLDIVKKWPLAKRECDIIWDARKDKIPFQDDSVSEIYAGYLLLHLAPRYHEKVLQEIRRVLLPTGILTVGEVDMKIVMKMWLENPESVNLSELIWGEQGSTHGEELSDYDKHCWGWTEEKLTKFLHSNGFKNINRTKIHCSEVFYELTLTCQK
jgi:predicted SAM-dependent methyltransferase